MMKEHQCVQKIIGVAVCPFCGKLNFWKFKCDHKVKEYYRFVSFEKIVFPRVNQNYKGIGKPGGKQ